MACYFSYFLLSYYLQTYSKLLLFPLWIIHYLISLTFFGVSTYFPDFSIVTDRIYHTQLLNLRNTCYSYSSIFLCCLLWWESSLIVSMSTWRSANLSSHQFPFTRFLSRWIQNIEKNLGHSDRVCCKIGLIDVDYVE